VSAFLQQLPALLGVVVGALGSFLAVHAGDRSRFTRERSARWEERRLIAYRDYSRALKASVSIMTRIAADRGNDPHPHPLPAEAGMPRLGEAFEQRDLAWEELLLLGSEAVVEAARLWFFAVAKLEGFAREDRADADTWSTLLQQQRVARAGFYDAARQDLSLPPGDPSL